MTARAGTYRWQDGSMEANGNVVVVSPDGRRLKTETLKYDNATNTISTNMHFSFDRGTEHLEGNSFRSDPGLQERRDRPAARDGRRRHAAAGPGAMKRTRSSGACSSCRVKRDLAGGGSSHVGSDLSDARALGIAWLCGRGRRVSVAAQAAPPGPKPAAPVSPVAALHLPDRQRRPAGRRERDADRHELLRRRQCPPELPRDADHDAERQRRGVRRQRRPVHRQREVPRLDAHDGRRPRDVLQERRAVGGPRQRRHPESSRPARPSTGPVARLLPGREGRAGHARDVRGRAGPRSATSRPTAPAAASPSSRT